MPEPEQALHIQSSLQALQQHSGRRPLGWLSQDWGSSASTYALLADAGLSYTLDWGNDEQPYWLEPAGASARRLLALPLSSEWDDVQGQWLRHVDAPEHAALILAGAQRMAKECLAQGRSAVMGLGLHPWVWGMPSRIAHLRRLLADLQRTEGLLPTSSDELYAQCASAS